MSLSKQQKELAIAQMMEFTQATPADAQRILRAHRWNIDQASDAFWNDPVALHNSQIRQNSHNSAQSDRSAANLGNLFDSYAGTKNAQTLDLEQMAAWLGDLEVDVESDPVVFALLYMVKSPRFGVIERKAWTQAWREQRRDTIDQQKAYISQLRSQFATADYYRKVYNFVFDLMKEEEGQRVLGQESALATWPALLGALPTSMAEPHSAFHPSNKNQQSAFIKKWCSFLETTKPGRAVSKDVWTNFLDFAISIDPEFTTFDVDAAWPSIIDEFVEYEKEKLGSMEE